VEELSRESSQITGEKSALLTQKKALEEKCMSEFNVSIQELPDLVTNLESESATILDNAEITLGLKAGVVKPMPKIESPVITNETPEVRASRLSNIPSVAKTVTQESRDDDSLMS
jgi:hypothetical protein